jgi:uncharacterized membrane protein
MIQHIFSEWFKKLSYRTMMTMHSRSRSSSSSSSGGGGGGGGGGSSSRYTVK